jgi:hypothetical protein
MTVGLLAMALVGGSATASGDPLTGTWHQRDNETSNIFYFIDAPVGGVYPVSFYDDYTGEAVCGDNGPMMWSGFVTESDEPNVFVGSFGTYWCPDFGRGEVLEDELGIGAFDIELEYHPESDTISGGIGFCEGTKQPSIRSVEKAIHEIAKGTYPPPDPDAAGSCEPPEPPTITVSLPSGDIHGNGFIPFHDEAQYQIAGAGWVTAGQVTGDGSVDVFGVASGVVPDNVVEMRIEGDGLLSQLTIVHLTYSTFNLGIATGAAASELEGKTLFVCWDNNVDPDSISDCTDIEIGDGVWEATGLPSESTWTNFIQLHDEEGDIQEVIYTEAP